MEPNTNIDATCESPAEYKIGFKCPPKDTQFKKGHTGNKNGRPRKVKNSLADDLAQCLDELVIDPDTKRKRIPRFQLVIRKHVTSARKGDSKALTWLIRAMDINEGEACQTEPDWRVLTYSDAKFAALSQTLDEEFYKKQDADIARWKKELRTGSTSIRRMIERELDRKVLVKDGARKVAMRTIIVARFIGKAAENPSVLQQLTSILPKKKYKRDYSRVEILRPTAEELKQ